MTNLGDVHIDHGPDEDGAGARTGRAAILAALVGLVLLLAAGAWFVLRTTTRDGHDTRAAVEQQPASDTAGEPRAALGAPAEAVDVPALDLSDPFVRELLQGLSDRPELAAWLTTDGLIRNFVVTVDNVAEGATPARHLRRLAPAEPFRAEARETTVVVDQRSYRRYDGLAETVSSLDPEQLAKVYSVLKPRLDEAYRELGHPDGNFDDAVERAVVHLLQTPPLEPEARLREHGVTYRYERASLERLSPAQKQLLRMGPRNVATVQERLRAFALALGIPESRLPPPHDAPGPSGDGIGG